ncbi:radical SAM protein [bacterium]|nr:radical SAM protein [bacterium]
MAEYINPVVSDGQGNIFEIPGYTMVGMSLSGPIALASRDVIPLPEGSDLFELPARIALAQNNATGELMEISHYHGQAVLPVTAFMAPAYIQIARTAFRSRPNAPTLPLFSYTAVGWHRGRFYVAGKRIDRDQRQDLRNFEQARLDKASQDMLRRYPANRLVEHLVRNCVIRYGCPAARNFVLERWECPAPVSPSCNARCVGCLSKQGNESGFVASMDRISFIPTVNELVEFCLPHLEKAARPVISFGQGCEGEPLLQGELIEKTIKVLRSKTQRGVINLNTNGSRPETVERLCQAGLDSIRLSLNSAQERYYSRYFRPRDYAFEQVMESMRRVARYERWISINYFIMPGFTDHVDEVKALEDLLHEIPINMIQTRNLNCDPELYQRLLGLESSPDGTMGIPGWLDYMAQHYPWLKLGYFNPPRVEMKKYWKLCPRKKTAVP